MGEFYSVVCVFVCGCLCVGVYVCVLGMSRIHLFGKIILSPEYKLICCSCVMQNLFQIQGGSEAWYNLIQILGGSEAPPPLLKNPSHIKGKYLSR